MLELVRIAATVCLAFVSFAWAADAADAQASARVGADSVMFGGRLRVDQPVAGDLIAAGGQLDLDAPVAGGAMLAGGKLRVTARIAEAVYAAGGQVTLDAPIGRHMRVAGGQVELGPQATVGGNVTVFGGQVTLRGAVNGAVTVAGGRVLIDGPVAGDVVSHAGRLTLGPNARLAGKLSFRSGDALERDPSAQVTGAIERQTMPLSDVGGAASSAQLGPASGEDRGWDRRAREWAAPGLWTVGLMLLAAVLVVVLPATSARVAQAVRTRFGWSVLLGFIALVCIPVSALLLALTIVGIPLALVAVLLYPALLLLGYTGASLALGQWALLRARPAAAAQRGWRIVAAVAAVFVLALLGSVPYVGGLVALLAMLAGVGAMLLLLTPERRLRSL